MNTAIGRKRWQVWLVAIFCLLPQQHLVFAQQAKKVWHIGLCHVGLDHEPPGLHSLHRALNDMGYEDGKNLRFDWRNQADAAAAARTMKKWVATPVDLIVGFEDQCVKIGRASCRERVEIEVV